jgi:hypothetical protein
VDPVYTLPYSEFCVAQQLSRFLPPSRGYSLYAPISRQEPGVDLVVVRRTRTGARAATIQVKSSRTYSKPAPIRRLTRPFENPVWLQYHTWYKWFECPPQADFFCLVALYPAVDAQQRRELGTWWAPQILLFSQREMRRFLASLKTKTGKRDTMFGFGFNDPNTAYQMRGDARRRFNDFSSHVLSRRAPLLRRFLSR